MSIVGVVTNNFWLKLLSLVLAVATWFYVFDFIDYDSLQGKKDTLEQMFARYSFETVDMPVKPLFSGKSPSGYRINFEKVITEPSSMVVFGPAEVFKMVKELRTDPIDISEYTKSVKISCGIQSESRFLRLKDKVVNVYLPVEKEAPKD
ncbi:MAG: YbbR-like domain-containing protein [Candidatus Omnitrophica bacterium]|jgi:hypothetical protein|nr:YbbR-like domain-containing protein [Candidatus Omnitrophota bacterium]